MKEITEIIEKEKVEFIDVKYVDLLGGLRHLTIPTSRLDAAVEHGLGIDGSSVLGFKGIEEGDMILKPDLSSYFIDPFYERATLSLFGEVYISRTNVRYSRDSRFVAQKAENHLKSIGVADLALFRSEVEFYIFDEAQFGEGPYESSFKIVSREHGETGGYHAVPPVDSFHELRSEICSILEKCGIEVKYHHHEAGKLSQAEIELDFSSPLGCGDNIVLAKYAIKNLAQAKGLRATFMPKPLHGEPGNGLHFHQRLTKNGDSIFGDQEAPLGISKPARNYIAGLLAHSRALCALTNASTNSYRRFLPGYEAPTYATYSLADRRAAVRIPGYITRESEMDIEYRPPDATCNPYLTISGMLMAGLDGIERKLDPGSPSAEEEEEHLRLPFSFDQALSALEEDSGFLESGDVFSEGLLEKWVSLKREEVEEIRTRPHQYEYLLYFDV